MSDLSPCIESELAPDNRKGYRRKRVNGVKRPVHRIEYEKHHGPIPDGMIIMHLCDNPACYNIEHLRLGTHQDNCRDKFAKGRDWQSKVTHCKNGHSYSGENLYQYNGRRHCRACRKANNQARSRNARSVN